MKKMSKKFPFKSERNFQAILIFLLALVFSCTSNESQSLEEIIPYKNELERGLIQQSLTLEIPLGRIHVLGGFSAFEGPDYERKRFPYEMLESMEEWEKLGLIEFTEHKRQGWDAMLGMGMRHFDLVANRKAIDQSDAGRSNEDWLYIPLGTATVQSVVKDLEYVHDYLPQSEFFRLVIGTFRFKPNSFAEQELNLNEVILKYRALMKINPINQTYSFQIADIGDPDKDEWATQLIP